jgi:NADH-quinone oxidoreductase subunit A
LPPLIGESFLVSLPAGGFRRDAGKRLSRRLAVIDDPGGEFMAAEYAFVGFFFLVGALFVALNIELVARLIRPTNPNPQKLSTYECGEEPIGIGWVRFHVRYYLYALVYIVFAVETVFLFPWAVVFQTLGWFAFVEMMIFIGILLVGLAYAWRKGALEWV